MLAAPGGSVLLEGVLRLVTRQRIPPPPGLRTKNAAPADVL